MSRYFFTIHMIDETIVTESDGSEFKDLAEARQEAIEAVGTMVLRGGLTEAAGDQSRRDLRPERRDRSLIPFEAPRLH